MPDESSCCKYNNDYCVFRTKLAIDSDRKLATDSGLKLATCSGGKLATFPDGPEWVANIAPE